MPEVGKATARVWPVIDDYHPREELVWERIPAGQLELVLKSNLHTDEDTGTATGVRGVDLHFANACSIRRKLFADNVISSVDHTRPLTIFRESDA